jgi:hypothetical protein
MKATITKMAIEKTKKGYPAVWESGGGYRNTGDATIVAGKSGQPKEAIYIRRRGSLANAPHALIVLEVGDHIVEAHHHREDFLIEVVKVLDFEEKDGEMFAIVETVSRFDYGEWDAELPAFLEAAVQAAVEKATCYHCREPHFVAVETQ